MTAIYVDADACPVKDEVIRGASRHGIGVDIVSNGGTRRYREPNVETVIVPHGPDVADDWIAERAGPGDVVITADIPLAARCLENKAQVLNHTGKPFEAGSIGMKMAMRDLNTHLRETGEISGYNPGFTAKDRSNFLNILENTVRTAKQQAAPRTG